MKKLFTLLVVLPLTLILSLNIVAKKDDVVRIHIRANSDSQADQQIKMLVRDEINKYLYPILSDTDSKKDAEEKIRKELSVLKKIAEETSKQDCTVKLTREEFPTKTYNNKVFPQGEYSALIIEIGKGEGRNWWCVAYPNMCYTKSQEDKPVYKSIFIEFLRGLGIL